MRILGQVRKMFLVRISIKKESGRSVFFLLFIISYCMLSLHIITVPRDTLDFAYHVFRDANLWRSKIWRFFFYNIPVSNYPSPPPQEKGHETSSASNRPPRPQIDLEFPTFTLTLQRKKGRFPKSSEDFLS